MLIPNPFRHTHLNEVILNVARLGYRFRPLPEQVAHVSLGVPLSLLKIFSPHASAASYECHPKQLVRCEDFSLAFEKYINAL